MPAAFAFASLAIVLLAAPASRAQDTFTFRGRVIDTQGRPVAGTGVLLGSAEDVLTTMALEQPTVRCAADGQFAVPVPTSELRVGAPTRCLLIAAPGKATLEQPLVAGWTLTMQQRAEIDLGDLVLDDGVTLKGRVRTTDGKPLARARVSAHDLVTAFGQLVWQAEMLARPRSHVLTAEDGTFTLPGTYPSAIEVQADAAGYYRHLLTPVSDRDPLVLELVPSGVVRGRVRGADGKPRSGTLQVVSEVTHGTQEIMTQADGTFATPLRFRGRYRLRFVLTPKRGFSMFETPAVLGESDLLTGPADDVTIQLKTVPTGTLRVHAVGPDGKRIAQFEAEVAWTNAEWLRSLDQVAMASADAIPADATGEARLPGPMAAEATSLTGIVRVRARGYVPWSKKDLKWEQDGQELEVKLEPESILAGVVIDPKTKGPIANAEVRLVLPASGDTEGRVLAFLNAARLGRIVRTGADGGFRVEGLAKGRYQVFAQAPGRPESRAQQVTLEPNQVKSDLKIPLPLGGAVAGTLVGGPLPPGARVVRFEEQGLLDSFAYVLTSSFFLGTDARAQDGVLVDAKGGFRLEGLPAGALDLALASSQPLRGGPPVVLKLDRVRLDPGETVVEDYDASGALPAMLEGRIQAHGDPIPLGRLCVRASGGGNSNAVLAMAQSFGDEGPHRCAVPGPDGKFRLALPPGTIELKVVDVATGIELAHEQIKTEAGKRVAKTLSFSVAKVRVRFTTEHDRPVVAERLVVHPAHQDGTDQMAIFVFLGGGNHIGLPLWCGPREVDVFVSPGANTFKVLSGAQRLDAHAQMMPDMTPLGELEHDVKAGDQPVLTIPLNPPPELR